MPRNEPTRLDLPLADSAPPERADAARNRAALLAAAANLVERCGPRNVTVDAVAVAAGVGKGTVFRRFESREGLMGALLNESETAWQSAVLSGPPPLGPGAAAHERLIAFGHSRIDLNLRHAELIREAGGSGNRNYAAISFTATHVRYLLSELGVRGDIAMLATALIAPLEVIIVTQQVETEGYSIERIKAGWDDLVRRVVHAP